jgi:hypothetical protein
MTYDAGSRKDVRRLEKEAKLAESNRLAYTKRIMGDSAGRKWMYDLLVRCHIWQTPFAAGQSDVTAFRIGEQNIGLQIFADVIAAAPQEYVLMMNEASQKELVHERRYSDDRHTNELPGSPKSERDDARPITEYDPYTTVPE